METTRIDKTKIFCFITCIGVWLFLLSGWTYTLDTDTPLGTDAPSVIDNEIRLAKDAWQERLNTDHYFPLTGSQVSNSDAGIHRQVHFQADISTPSTTSDQGHVYQKSSELYWLDGSGNELQLTDSGTINIVSADLLGTVANDTYFTAVDQAGTGTVDLIKADSSDVAVIPDGSQLATSAAPTDDADIANMKYVDDQGTWVPAVSGAGAGYAGEESVTFPNGLITKFGSLSISAGGSATVTFESAFDNSIISAACSGQRTTGAASPITMTAVSTSAITFYSFQAQTVHWQAYGY